MCGICGIYGINGLTKEDLQLFEKTLIQTESRGNDAFGYYLYPSKDLFKTKGAVTEYLKKHKSIYTKWLNNKIVLAHTRATTTGKESYNPNNHPFETDNFVLAHNGVISNTIDFGYKSDIETDSYVIIKGIQDEYDKNKDIVKAIKTICEKLQGSFACWLLDKESGTIYLFRHNNPIEIRYDRDRQIILFASEQEFLEPFRDENILVGFFKTLFTGRIEENKIYKIDTNGGLIELDTFIPMPSCWSEWKDSICMNRDKKELPLYNGEYLLKDEIWEATGYKFDVLKEMLSSYGIQMILRKNKILLYFDEGQPYEIYKDSLQHCGWTISPKTRTLVIDTTDGLAEVVELVLDSYDSIIDKCCDSIMGKCYLE